MRTILALLIATLLPLSTTSMAATVEYQHPDLTIVAKEEPLQSVLKSVGKEMRIFITTPTGINPLVSCDIQNQPIKLAFKKLLGDMSYSLEWEDGGERLVGLTILAGGEGVATASGRPSHTQTGEQAASVPVASGGNRPPVEQSANDAPDATAAMADHDAEIAEHEARMEDEREEREAQEAEMVIRQQEQEIAHEERMKKEEAQIEAEAATHLAAEGIEP